MKTNANIIIVILLSITNVVFSQIIYYEAASDTIVGEEIYFEARGLGGNIPYLQIDWDFGDGFVTQGMNGRVFMHTYRIAGEYLVKLYVDDILMDTAILSIKPIRKKLPPLTADDPIVELKFENNLADSSGNNNHAEWYNGTGEFTTGVEGMALDLTSGHYPFVPDLRELENAGEFTISFWFKRKSIENSTYIDLLNLKNALYMYMVDNGQGFFGRITSGGIISTAEIWHKNFESNRWRHIAFIYDGSQLRFFLDDDESTYKDRCPRAYTGNLPDIIDTLFIGKSSTRDGVFNGYIDELKIYDRALSIEELSNGFDLWHADFHSRYAQYLYAKIPSAYIKASTNRIVANITNNTGYKDELINKGNLAEEERFLLQNSDLPIGDYTLSVQIQNESGAILDQIIRQFSKTYNGAPKVGIDENNAFRIEDELFFPVTPFCQNTDYAEKYIDSNYINCFYGQGFYPEVRNLSSWQNYLNFVSEKDALVFGPALWPTNNSRNASVDTIEDYVRTTMSHKSLMGWIWDDEPELGGNETGIAPQVIRAWTYKTHSIDNELPVFINLVGPNFTKDKEHSLKIQSDKYFFYSNREEFGERTFIADVYGMDYYPVDWASPHSNGFTMTGLADALDVMLQRTYNLVPCFSFIETCNINEEDNNAGVNNPTPWHPTPEMLKMLIWINITHGVKGINWFPYHSGTPDNNFPVMKEFLKQITELTPVICGPDIEQNCQVSISGEGRVDVMLKEFENKLYVFAVRISELEGAANTANTNVYNQGGYPDPVQNYPLTATFSFENPISSSVEVMYEGRQINAQSSSFSDVFEPYEVHIYSFDLKGTSRGNENSGFSNSNRLKVFPNPTEGILYVEFDDYQYMELFNLFGEHLFRTSDKTIDISDYMPGIYFLVIVDNHGKRIPRKILHTK